MIVRAAIGPFWCPHFILTYLLCLAQLSSSKEALYPNNGTHTPPAAPEGNPGTSNHSAVINGTTQSSATSTITTDPISALYPNNGTLWTHTPPASTEENPGTSNHSSAIDGTTQSSANSTITTDPISALYPINGTLWTHTPPAATEGNPGTSNHSAVIDGTIQSSVTITANPLSALYPNNGTLWTHTPPASTEGNPGTSNHSSVIDGTTQSSATSTITTDPISALYPNNGTLWTHMSLAATEGNPGTSNHSTVIDGTTQSSVTSTITTDPISALYPNNGTLWTHTPPAATEGNPGTSNHSTEIDGTTQSSAISTITTDPISGDLICLHNSDCPPYSSCLAPLSGIVICQCDMGYFLHVTLGCIMARTFPARVSLSALRWNPDAPWSEEPMLQEKMWSLSSAHVRTLFRAALGSVDGYLSTSIHRLDLPGGHAVVLHYFSPLYPVSEQLVDDAVTQSLSSCTDGPGCALSADVYQGLSLCHFELCDPLSSSCTHRDGLLSCLCRDGYYKYHAWDRSCTACESGFQWKDGSCLRCGFGFGGFNCNESFLLTMVVEACVLGVLGISFIVLLFSYMRKKKSAKPTLMDGIALRFPSDQPVIRLPRPQFSLRSTWDWDGPPLSPGPNTQPDKDPTSEPPEIQMKTFGESPRSAVSSQYRGSSNLAFISDD